MRRFTRLAHFILTKAEPSVTFLIALLVSLLVKSRSSVNRIITRLSQPDPCECVTFLYSILRLYQSLHLLLLV